MSFLTSCPRCERRYPVNLGDLCPQCVSESEPSYGATGCGGCGVLLGIVVALVALVAAGGLYLVQQVVGVAAPLYDPAPGDKVRMRLPGVLICEGGRWPVLIRQEVRGTAGGSRVETTLKVRARKGNDVLSAQTLSGMYRDGVLVLRDAPGLRSGRDLQPAKPRFYVARIRFDDVPAEPDMLVSDGMRGRCKELAVSFE